MRPEAHCICDLLPTVTTTTQVVVIQHPNERTHPFGTAKILGLALPNATVHTVYGGLSQSLHLPLEVPADSALLYPHPDAIEVEDIPLAERPSTLVVLDGTWSHSRRLYHENPWLQDLRHVRITPATPSNYRIRKEPRPECLSTLEATVCALRAFESQDTHAGLDALLRAFDGMIDRQIDHTSTAPRQLRYRRPRQRERRDLSPLLNDPGFVVLYAESALPGGQAGAERELVQIAAAHLGTGATLELLLRPRGAPPPPGHMLHMGITLADLEAGVTVDEARARLAEFAGSGPFGAWTKSSLDWSAPLLPAGAATTQLKTNYCNVQNRGSGYLEDVVAREGLTPKPVDCHGRAAVRLANAIAIGRWLRDRQAARSGDPS